ncbi:MAG TPA: CxxxxCH/CxxCH domain-containing protein, partial [Bacteroidota bacterium]|nr:CxxxxCH/CxxCH domain-containing protein [Bacteroidota bacterium]
HGMAIEANQWKMDACKTCHGANYNGIATGSNVGCMSSGCHVDANGNQKTPESCNTCHGKFTGSAGDMLTWAPPRAVNGDSLTTVRGVGAHQEHLNATFGKALQCQECHTVPGQLYAAGHLDHPLPATVAMKDTLANLVTAAGTFVPHPSYDAAAIQCNNTYCHGNWQVTKASAPADRQYIYVDSVISGDNYSPKWTGGAGEAACGSCHGLPPKGHLGPFLLTSCGGVGGCHEGVVDASGNILDPTKHMNGKIDVGNTERSF